MSIFRCWMYYPCSSLSNEMSVMGGLKKYMPITHATFLISCLAIAGIPFFSGFSSKDEIISALFLLPHHCGWWMTGVAAMTAFYMFRLYYGIFWGTENKELHAHHAPHEAPLTMTLPLVSLISYHCRSRNCYNTSRFWRNQSRV